MTTTPCPASVQLTGKDPPGPGEGCSAGAPPLRPRLSVGQAVGGCSQEVPLARVSVVPAGRGSSGGLTPAPKALPVSSSSEGRAGSAGGPCCRAVPPQSVRCSPRWSRPPSVPLGGVGARWDAVPGGGEAQVAVEWGSGHLGKGGLRAWRRGPWARVRGTTSALLTPAQPCPSWPRTALPTANSANVTGGTWSVAFERLSRLLLHGRT